MAIAVATLSHGLYDLRRAAQRTLLWLTMSGVAVGIYALVVIAAAALVPGHKSWWPSALAAAAAALLLIPLQEKLQRGVTRVVYGRWHEPYEVLAGLGENLEAAADIDRLIAAAVAELNTGLDLRDVSVRDMAGTVVTGTGAGADSGTPARPSGPASLSRQHDLTARECEVLDLLAEGASNRQIARSLGLSLKTVQNHVSRILDKLQADDRTQAALRARGVPPTAR